MDSALPVRCPKELSSHVLVRRGRAVSSVLTVPELLSATSSDADDLARCFPTSFLVYLFLNYFIPYHFGAFPLASFGY